jgi:ubiquinol-cytochrome c reductase iron-sulfur subunit
MFTLRRTAVPLSRGLAKFQPRCLSSAAADHMGTYCDNMEKARIAPGDESKRAFTYFALSGARFMYASAARLTVMKFVATISASADVLALASLECDIGKVAVGDTVTVKWRGKPVFVRHRTADEIAEAEAVDVKTLLDQQTDAERVQKAEWLICLGVCTHLGCVPLVNQGDYNGWFCPCHGSHYDTSARIRKGPAPLNLEVPPYKFMEGDTKLLIG